MRTYGGTERCRCWGTEVLCVGVCALEGFVFEVKRNKLAGGAGWVQREDSPRTEAQRSCSVGVRLEISDVDRGVQENKIPDRELASWQA